MAPSGPRRGRRVCRGLPSGGVRPRRRRVDALPRLDHAGPGHQRRRGSGLRGAASRRLRRLDACLDGPVARRRHPRRLPRRAPRPGPSAGERLAGPVRLRNGRRGFLAGYRQRRGRSAPGVWPPGFATLPRRRIRGGCQSGSRGGRTSCKERRTRAGDELRGTDQLIWRGSGCANGKAPATDRATIRKPSLSAFGYLHCYSGVLRDAPSREAVAQ